MFIAVLASLLVVLLTCVLVSPAPTYNSLGCISSPIDGVLKCEDQFRLLSNGEKTAYCTWTIFVCMANSLKDDLENLQEDVYPLRQDLQALTYRMEVLSFPRKKKLHRN